MSNWLHTSALALSLCFATLGAEAAELKIGSELPLTGDLARVGAGMNEGIQVAAEIFNKQNGKHTVKHPDPCFSNDQPLAVT